MEEIKADFSAVQPPEGYGFVATSDNGQIIGFFGLEMDLELGRSWLFGPLVEEPNWDATAEQLYQAILVALPPEINDLELYCLAQNSRVQKFALQQGFPFHAEGAVLVLDVSQRERNVAFDDVEFDEEYALQLAVLHAELFPNTYYSAEQLINLSKEDDKHLLIHLISGNLVGYIFAQVRSASQDGYIDFVGVEESFRRQGIGSSLVAQAVDWAVQKPFVNKITMTVNINNKSAIHMYHALGFTTETVSQAYRKQN
jgi:ribosomal protein S18 acetylase RimI-like enzyme